MTLILIHFEFLTFNLVLFGCVIGAGRAIAVEKPLGFIRVLLGFFKKIRPDWASNRCENCVVSRREYVF